MEKLAVIRLESFSPLVPVFGRAAGCACPAGMPEVAPDDRGRAARFMPEIVREGVFSPQELAARAGLEKPETFRPQKPAPSPAGEDVAEMPPASLLRLQREEAARLAYLRQKYPLQAPLLDMLG